jgi:hypothetical protein
MMNLCQISAKYSRLFLMKAVDQFEFFKKIFILLRCSSEHLLNQKLLKETENVMNIQKFLRNLLR